MSTITTYPLNGIDYDAADVAAYESTRTSGVYSADEDFAVTAAGGLNITVSAGRAWIHPSRFEGYSITKRDPETITLPLADGSRPRIDRIILRYDAAAKKTSLLTLTGDPASSPTAPAITRTSLTYDLCLAEISRPAGSTAVTTGQITDTRLDEDLCGVMSDGVTGLPTAQLLIEARARIAEVEETASDSAAKAAASQSAAAQAQAGAEAAMKKAQGSEEAAKQSEANAGQSAEKAAASEGNAKASEDASKASEEAAAKSEAAAKASQAAAATSEANAEKYAKEAGAKAGTDKTLSIEDAPADAAAVRALIKELLAAQREEDYAKIRFWVSPDPTSPAQLFGGTWERIEGRIIMGASDSYPVGTTGGSATHTQSVAEMPGHTHTGSTGEAGWHGHSASTNSTGGHTHSASTGGAGGHNHTVSAAQYAGLYAYASSTTADHAKNGSTTTSGSPTTSWVGDHSHSVSVNSAGAHSHTVSVSGNGTHTHTVSIGSTGSGQAMDILNPYLALYMWRRVEDAA